MADPIVWGMLPKAQDDPTTIDEAIAAAIAAHDDDPTAHLDVGQSLETHRANDMIDHPAGSVPFDKVSKEELYHYDNFLSPTSVYDPNGDVAAANAVLSVSVFHVVSGEGDATIPIPLFQNATFPMKEIVAQFDASFDYSATIATSLLLIGSDDDGFGLKVATNTLKAFFRHNGTDTLSASLTYTPGQFKTFRFHLVPADSKVYVYMDGVQVASISTASSSSPDLSRGAYIQVNAGGTTYSFVYISALRLGYRRDLL